ncbi:MAG: putative lipid II flippase FtsW [Eggerthellaceae bacterium]|nr:putative lipid II flippase FtsW [Eggerthellaceae bacterium]
MARDRKNSSLPASQAGSARRSSSVLFGGSRDVVIPRVALVASVIVLTVFGLIMVFSSSTIEAINEDASVTSYLFKQLGIVLFSLVMCAAMSIFIPYYRWRGRLLDAFMLGTIVLLLLTALIGTVGLGAQRWLSIGPISFQPSEFAKVAFLAMAARVYAELVEGEIDLGQALIRAGLLVVLPLGLLFVTQSDLGTTMICLVGIVAVLWLGEVPIRYFVVFLILIVLVAIFGIASAAYRSSRFAFLDPWADPYGSGYQLIRAFYAFGEGGLFGVGLGNSAEKYLYLPEAETDFIFAIIGEEFGLVGAVVIVALFICVLWAGLRIARNAPDLFGTMIAGGCTIMLVFQAFLNIGCVIGLLPTTGKPLPFISSGGSSMIGSYLLVGMILSVSFASGSESGLYQKRRESLRVVRAESPTSSSRGTSSRSSQRPRRSSERPRSSSTRPRNTSSSRSSRSTQRSRRRR